MNPHIFTAQEVLTAFRALVEEYGEDHRAESAYSDPAGLPECLIGAIIAKIHPPTFELIKDSYKNITELSNSLDIDYPTRPIVFETRRLRYLVYRAQAEQDDQRTWGECLKDFESFVS